MEFQTKHFTFSWETDYTVGLHILQETDSFLKLKLSINFHEKCVPETVTIKWRMPCTDIFSQWNPSAWFDHCLMPDWLPVRSKSRSAAWAPVQTHLSLSGRNRSTVALKDVRTPLEICSGVYEEDACIHFRLNLFTQQISAISEYETELIIDTRDIPYEDALNHVQNWWAECGFPCAPVPENARRPMYSTWYSWHQQLSPEALLPELEEAKALGMDTVIVDDGWQTDDNNRGYAYCGDWIPTAGKIPDMKAFVDAVHHLGMKYMMWYSVPFVGKHAAVWERFKDKFLNGTDRRWSILDPRYPEVREFLVSIYEKAVKDWGLDGLKLDFIDSFELSEQSHAPDASMDYASLEDGVCALLRETKTRLRAINPDILIEFRQNYMGPIMRSYGNMIRVADCPDDALKNRVGSIHLRLTSGRAAVHSDMLMWNYSEPVEAAALQFINILFSVPQISVVLKTLPAAHKAMLQFYLDFWNNNRACILDGTLSAKNPEANYSLVYTRTDSELVAVAYSKNILDVDRDYQKISFINGCWDAELFIRNHAEGYPVRITVYTCTGEVVSASDGTLAQGCNAFSVPRSGLLEIEALPS